MKVLQDFIAPYVRLDDPDGRSTVGTVHGTAFFINQRGAFLTARHVVQNCQADIDTNGGIAALVMRDDSRPELRFSGRVENLEFADMPYDIAVGIVHRASKGYFVFGEGAKAWMWEDVYTAGYPSSATRVEPGYITIDARGHKGHILRRVRAGHVLMHPHPDVIEVSFAITRGMSGGPLVMRNAVDTEGKPLPYFVLLGVCVSNEPSRVVDFSYTEVLDGNKEFRETTERIEEYGIAHDLRPLADWRPSYLAGLSLKEAVQPDVP